MQDRQLQACRACLCQCLYKYLVHLEPALPFLAPLALDQAVAASVRLALDQRDQWGQRGQWSLAMGCPLLVVLQGSGRQGAFPILVRPALVRQDLAYLEPVAWALVPPLVVLPLVVQPLVVQPLAVLLARVLYQRAGSGVSCHLGSHRRHRQAER